MANAEAQAEIESVEAFIANRDAADSSLLLDGTTHPRPGKKTSRAHARAELDLLRQHIRSEAKLDRHIQVQVSILQIETLADVAQVLNALKEKGVTYDALARVADTVWPDR